jgi:hypothetical protein
LCGTTLLIFAPTAPSNLFHEDQLMPYPPASYHSARAADEVGPRFIFLFLNKLLNRYNTSIPPSAPIDQRPEASNIEDQTKYDDEGLKYTTIKHLPML